MPYYKIVNANDSTNLYNTEIDPPTMIVESDGLYQAKESDKTSGWLRTHVDEIDQEEFETKADNISDYARIGTHPPAPPGGGG